MTGSAGPAFAILESIESTSQKVLVKIAFWSDPDKTRKGTPQRGVGIAAKLAGSSSMHGSWFAEGISRQ
jgi:hypothetical protein